MPKHGKKYRAIKGKAPKEALGLNEAIVFIKENPAAKFDETVEIAFRLGIDPKKTENAVRGSVSLPNGTGKEVCVLVFASGAAAESAKNAGADFVGADDMIEKVKGGWMDFDVAISTPDLMGEVKKLGRVLGPRGLMPNPKTGTVTDDTAGAVKAAKTGKVDFRMDKNANVGVPFGKISFDLDKLIENGEAVIAAVKAEKPGGLKGIYIKSCSVSSTMGVGVKVRIAE